MFLVFNFENGKNTWKKAAQNTIPDANACWCHHATQKRWSDESIYIYIQIKLASLNLQKFKWGLFNQNCIMCALRALCALSMQLDTEVFTSIATACFPCPSSLHVLWVLFPQDLAAKYGSLFFLQGEDPEAWAPEPQRRTQTTRMIRHVFENGLKNERRRFATRKRSKQKVQERGFMIAVTPFLFHADLESKTTKFSFCSYFSPHLFLFDFAALCLLFSFFFQFSIFETCSIPQTSLYDGHVAMSMTVTCSILMHTTHIRVDGDNSSSFLQPGNYCKVVLFFASELNTRF